MDANDFGMRLAKLEAEIEELEQLQRDRRRKAAAGSGWQDTPATAFSEIRGTPGEQQNFESSSGRL
jgi:hypothetical protein